MTAPDRLRPPLIELSGVARSYSTGEAEVHALRDVNLRIEAGEMVAIVGTSGSGKSTLLHLLGGLDQPSQGQVRIDGVALGALSPAELARLRRERFGFVFQRYYLLGDQDALANVSMPAIYAGIAATQRGERARHLLARLGLAERMAHLPAELSGGQQQRVSVARALINGGEVILADEPTGALDNRSGKDMLALLLQLNRQGHTVVIVTHDPKVAAHAPRVVQIEDGRVVHDSGWPSHQTRAALASPAAEPQAPWTRMRLPLGRLRDALHMAWTALLRHRLRSFLGTLGIGVGIAAVVGVLALGQAMRGSVEATLRSFLSNKLMLSAGKVEAEPGDPVQAFTEEDVRALRDLDQVQSVRPKYEAHLTARQDRRQAELSVVGLAPGDLALEGYSVRQGRDLGALDRDAMAQVMVLPPNARAQLFGADPDPVGRTVMLGALPFVVVGLTGPAASNNAGANWQGQVFVPDSTLVAKVLGRREVQELFVYMRPGADPQAVQRRVTQTLTQRHGREDFTLYNQEAQFRQAGEASNTMRLVLAVIASISLLVGGVGVMNMMLVAVTERTPEIGIRMAVGARPGDVQAQFLIEATVLCAIGGFLGLLLSAGLIWAMNLFKPDLHAALSAGAVGLAFAVSSAMGLFFGFVPARQASRLNPVLALARE